MNYKIITDEAKFKLFIDWLPNLKEGEKFYVSLFARKKYAKDQVLSSDKAQLKRFLATKENLYDKVKQLECEVDSYKLKTGSAPQESLALYISPNPRSMRKATFQVIKKAADLIQNDNIGYNIHAETLSCIQRCKGTSHFCDFDIDTKEVDLTKMFDILPRNAYSVLETRGGYHILVHTWEAPKTKWHKHIIEAFDVDQVGDQLIPVAGCTQGGFTPYFL